MAPANNNISKTTIWVGRVISGLCVLFLLFDGITKVMQVKRVTDAMTLLGFPQNLTVAIGITVLSCTVLYVVPQTSILGAVLLTGFLGGATATMVRVNDSAHPFWFPVLFGALIWMGLYLRSPKLRALVF